MRDRSSRRNLQGYIFQTGQPPECGEAFLAAMGFSEAELEPEPQAFDPARAGAADCKSGMSPSGFPASEPTGVPAKAGIHHPPPRKLTDGSRLPPGTPG